MADAKEKQFKRFKKLPEEWRNDMMGRGRDELFKKIADAAIAIVASETAKQFDQDIAKLKEQLATAQEGYKETKNTKSLQIEFLIETLRSQGVDVPSLQDFISGAVRVGDDGEIEDAEKTATESHHRVDKIVAEAAKKIAKGLGKGTSMTISVPGQGLSATIEGEGGDDPDDEEDEEERE
jgi:hypothetical protein